MTMNAADVVRGAAVVIDDRIGEESGIDALLKQLKNQSVPTVELRGLPPTESLVHWKQFALIVMDWRLTGGEDEPEIEIPGGVAIPSTLSSQVVNSNIEFLSALLAQTALPVFIATNDDVDTIRTTLAERFASSFPNFEERVHVFSKRELQPDLFSKVADWLDLRPALKVLNAWRKAYVEAEVAVFHDFSQAQEDWVASVQRAAAADKSPLSVTLRDLLAANVLNRVGPLVVELQQPGNDESKNADALRRVLHLSAVVPAASLHGGEPYTGDLYVPEDASEDICPEIRILLTPECELVNRGQKEWRYTYVTASRRQMPDTQKKQMEALAKPQREHIVSSLLTANGDLYEIPLKSWRSEHVVRVATGGGREAGDSSGVPSPWPGFKRIGRLLDPYLTNLQQHFALYAVRKGLPGVPNDFFHGWAEPEIEAVTDDPTHDQ